MHSGGTVPEDGVYTLQKGEKVIPAKPKKGPRYDDMADNSTPDIRVERSTGSVKQGAAVAGVDSPVQPDPDLKTGAADARVRKPASASVNFGGHHVSQGGKLAEKGFVGHHATLDGDSHLGQTTAKNTPESRHVHTSSPEALARKNYTDEQYRYEDFAGDSKRTNLRQTLAKGKK